MYSQKVIARKALELESAFPITLKEHTLDEVDEWTARLNKLVHPDSTPTNFKGLVKPMSEEEKAWVSNEIMMCRINYPYWATHYGWIRNDKGGEVRIKFWESQEMMLNIIADK